MDEEAANQVQHRKAVEALRELADAAELMLAFHDDLAKSNPGFLGKLCLQDYARANEALLRLPQALAKARLLAPASPPR